MSTTTTVNGVAEEYAATLARLVREGIQRRGLPLSEVEAFVGISPSDFVWRLAGTEPWDLGDLTRLARLLGTTPSMLLTAVEADMIARYRDGVVVGEAEEEEVVYLRSVPLDMAYDEPTLEDAIDRMWQDYGVEILVVREVGPAAGWPEVVVSGPADKVVRAVREAWGFGEEAIER